jgi:hypothetical protein
MVPRLSLRFFVVTLPCRTFIWQWLSKGLQMGQGIIQGLTG